MSSFLSWFLSQAKLYLLSKIISHEYLHQIYIYHILNNYINEIKIIPFLSLVYLSIKILEYNPGHLIIRNGKNKNNIKQSQLFCQFVQFLLNTFDQLPILQIFYFSLNFSASPMSVVEFVDKLLTILEKQPQTVQWISNGRQFQIVDIKNFTDKILPIYFRHRKFQSFIRQLNMYGFHKVNRRKNSHIFEHEHFIKDRQADYKLIKRAKKMKIENKTKANKNSNINVDTVLLNERAPKMAELLNKLIEFNTQNQFDYRKLKSKLDLLSRQVSAKKQRNLRPIIKSIRQKVVMLDEIQRNISNLEWNTLTNQHIESPTKSNDFPNEIKNKIKVMSAPVMGQKQNNEAYVPHDQVSLYKICSFKSISSFIAFG